MPTVNIEQVQQELGVDLINIPNLSFSYDSHSKGDIFDYFIKSKLHESSFTVRKLLSNATVNCDWTTCESAVAHFIASSGHFGDSKTLYKFRDGQLSNISNFLDSLTTYSIKFKDFRLTKAQSQPDGPSTKWFLKLSNNSTSNPGIHGDFFGTIIEGKFYPSSDITSKLDNISVTILYLFLVEFNTNPIDYIRKYSMIEKKCCVCNKNLSSRKKNTEIVHESCSKKSGI